MMVEESLERLRALCMAFPEVTERPSHGEPTWFVKGKRTFVMFANHHHDDRLAFWCAAPMGAQEAMINSNPTKFFRPPYVGSRGWIGVYLDVEVNWNEIEEVVQIAFKKVAGKT